METLQRTEHQISVLNDLIKINNDRIRGYKKRMSIMLDNDLEDLFFKFIYQSRQNIDELTKYIYLLGGNPVDRTSLSGKFYHAWMDFTSTIIKQGRQTLLDYCEYSEDVSKDAYNKALNDKDLLWENKKMSHLLSRQLADLKISHQLVKTLRDESALSLNI
jgi:uncharacterized protein (TIGR02284 family)